MSDIPHIVGVIGAGSFGTAIANLLAYNVDVLLYSRQASLVDKINRDHRHLEVDLSQSVRATNDINEICQECSLLFPVVPSNNFRNMMRTFGPHLRPYHILIHGTKGFDAPELTANGTEKNKPLTREEVSTMSEVIRQESSVMRVGCLSGPTIATELARGLPDSEPRALCRAARP